ncbi:MAG: hypothetical protein KDD34_05670 [Bdellovibrionales bacterium]|nr:hypothetical protein [Bdellovibrionales bacterium]
MIRSVKSQVKSKVRNQSWGENLSLKVMSLFVALVLWAVMLGRKDITLSKEVETQVLVPPNMQVTSEMPSRVQVEVSGPRIALKKFTNEKIFYVLDLEGLAPGSHLVRLTKDGINLPLGVRLLSLRPKEINAVITPVKD